MHVFFTKRCSTQNMRRQAPVWIKPHLTTSKQQARLANIMHRLLLFRGDFFLHPVELTSVFEPTFQLCGIQVGENFRQLLRRKSGINHFMRVRIDGVCFQIGGQNAPLAVDDIRPLRLNTTASVAGAWLGGFRRADNSHPRTNCEKRARKQHAHDQQSPLSPRAPFVAHVFVPLTQVRTFNLIRVFPGATRVQNRRKRAQRLADHGLASSEETSTAFSKVIGASLDGNATCSMRPN
mmetsp:Transcript_28852/g.54926  ORF Transcript_28852/g.54926 Transcript_28852/m.54926 type:complete len:236 (-) Transcript_28852:1020-1727(-)